MDVEVAFTCKSSASSIEYIMDVCHTTFERFKLQRVHILKFLIHEALINTVEAISKKYNSKQINQYFTFQLKLSQDIEIRVIDSVGGLSQAYLDQLNPKQLENILWQESGRGLLLIKEKTDKMWYKELGNETYEFGFKIMGVGNR
ncbi:ATP-binding protein [Bacillus tianshenii]|nr:ATP-binding protein [Bacillus tianshenii]